MARPLRIEYDGAWYHVMNRGLARNKIFFDDTHRACFLDLLFEAHNKYQAEFHAYCLMGNHYHIFIRTPLGNLSRIMRHIDGVYTQRFNRSVKRDGPLFRGRYKAILVEADVYLLRLTRYIHLNPVMAKLVEKPEEYEWSSYRTYLEGDAPLWLNTRSTLSYFGKNSQVTKYKAFVNEGVDKEIDSFYQKLKNSPILGTKAFTETVSEKHLKEEHRIDDIPEHKALLYRPIKDIKVDDIVSATVEYYECNRSDIFSPKKGGGNRPRMIAIYLAYILGNNSLSSISGYFKGISSSGVSKTCKRVDEKVQCDFSLRKAIEKIKLYILAMSNVKT